MVITNAHVDALSHTACCASARLASWMHRASTLNSASTQIRERDRRLRAKSRFDCLRCSSRLPRSEDGYRTAYRSKYRESGKGHADDLPRIPSRPRFAYPASHKYESACRRQCRFNCHRPEALNRALTSILLPTHAQRFERQCVRKDYPLGEITCMKITTEAEELNGQARY